MSTIKIKGKDGNWQEYTNGLSANQVNSLINEKIKNKLDINSIDDTNTANDKLWSASKINTELERILENVNTSFSNNINQYFEENPIENNTHIGVEAPTDENVFLWFDTSEEETENEEENIVGTLGELMKDKVDNQIKDYLTKNPVVDESFIQNSETIQTMSTEIADLKKKNGSVDEQLNEVKAVTDTLPNTIDERIGNYLTENPIDATEQIEGYMSDNTDNDTIIIKDKKIKVDKFKITNRINVLDYGIKNDGVTDNTEKLNKMFETIPWGSVVYFPVGVYNISGQISLPRTVTLVGESIKIQNHSLEPKTIRNESQIVYVGNTPNISLFVRTGIGIPIAVQNLTFMTNKYRVTENTDEFTTLPYPYFKQEITLENINCLNLSSKGATTVKDCTFTGFSGYAVSINDHTYIKDCGFYSNKLGIKSAGTDSLIQNCWICHGGTGILLVDSETESWTFSNINVSDCWCDQMTEHFIKSENTNACMLLIDNAWVDMIDCSAIYAECVLKESRINGRFSRCGMSYAGITDEDRTEDIYYMADAIVAKEIYDSVIDISINKRSIGKGNNLNGICCSKAVSVINNIMRNVKIIGDEPVNDLAKIGSGTKNTKLIGTDKEILNHSIWQYEESPIIWRTITPVGKVEAPKANCLCIDTRSGSIYYSTAPNDKNAWIKISGKYITPQMFGAKGDGVTDDSDALKSAFNSGLPIYLPKGTYLCSKAFNITSEHIDILGEDKSLSIIRFTETSTPEYNRFINIVSNTININKISIEYIYNGETEPVFANTEGILVRISKATEICNINDCCFKVESPNVKMKCMPLWGRTTTGEINNFTVSNCDIYNLTNEAIDGCLWFSTETYNAKNISIKNNRIYTTNKDEAIAIWCQKTYESIMENVDIYDNIISHISNNEKSYISENLFSITGNGNDRLKNVKICNNTFISEYGCRMFVRLKSIFEPLFSNNIFKITDSISEDVNSYINLLHIDSVRNANISNNSITVDQGAGAYRIITFSSDMVFQNNIMRVPSNIVFEFYNNTDDNGFYKNILKNNFFESTDDSKRITFLSGIGDRYINITDNIFAVGNQNLYAKDGNMLEYIRNKKTKSSYTRNISSKTFENATIIFKDNIDYLLSFNNEELKALDKLIYIDNAALPYINNEVATSETIKQIAKAYNVKNNNHSESNRVFE